MVEHHVQADKWPMQIETSVFAFETGVAYQNFPKILIIKL